MLRADRWLNVGRRPNDWYRACSIAAIDRNTQRVALTSKTSQSKNERAWPVNGEQRIPFSSRVAHGDSTRTEAYPQKDNS